VLLGTGLNQSDPVARLRVLRVPGWERVPDLRHGFLTRHGGVSRGEFATLNLSRQVGDDCDAVSENWRRVVATAGSGVRFAIMRQVHGARVLSVSEATDVAGEADGLATRTRGVALGVLTADCVPMLLLAPRHGVVAAVHAGWRGTIAGIGGQAIRHLDVEFGVPPSEIHAALGPAIGGCCYETERDLVTRLEQRWGALPDIVAACAGTKVRWDLRRANAELLLRHGVPEGQIATVGPCTRCSPHDFFSHRGAAGRTGRQLSFIGWNPAATAPGR
jgi:YfiH family protein